MAAHANITPSCSSTPLALAEDSQILLAQAQAILLLIENEQDGPAGPGDIALGAVASLVRRADEQLETVVEALMQRAS